ncbi:ubiquitin-like protein FUBI [Fukomys damarensis]|uniref:Ubiquitin-like protein FUBI n=1 Tax=Fukomys damarensis TaxID=885580 RepID=A0A091CU85_FUKDA|nr:ubiquitin-like protein FUBI [Fukomys damarensis]KFO21155.1 Ubiquitin-like protein FUBI [Fukomys damarensis]
MQLFARTQDLHILEVISQEMVTKTKAPVASLEGVTPEDQVALAAGKLLEDDATLGQRGVEALATLEVAGCMLGGKALGFLAWAGKVRGQTPQMTKEEGGEGRRRRQARPRGEMQYSRHFADAMPTFCKKRGPNANA